MFDLDQRVLCIRSGWGSTAIGSEFQLRICPNIPFRGRIYHVRTIDRPGEIWFVRLRELINPINQWGMEPWFEADRFVPIIERDTDIGFARDILAGCEAGPVEEPAKILAPTRSASGAGRALGIVARNFYGPQEHFAPWQISGGA